MQLQEDWKELEQELHKTMLMKSREMREKEKK